MQVLRHLKNVTLTLALLGVLVLLGIRLYENAYIWDGQISTVTHVIFPLLWPCVLVCSAVTAVLWAVYGLLRGAQKRRERRMSV